MFGPEPPIPPPTPIDEPDDPLRDPEHFHASPDIGPAMDVDAKDDKEVHQLEGFPDLFSPDSDDEKMEPNADDMVQLLVSLDVDENIAQNFVNAVIQKKLPPLTTFVEVYGRGGICEEAAKNPNLNINGLHSFDLRAPKPGGKSWDFSKQKDRHECRQMIRRLKPKWIVGSPPCTSFSSWNVHMNYPKMDPEEVRRRQRAGRQHMRFAIQLYQRQLDLGRHFLHGIRRQQRHGTFLG